MPTPKSSASAKGSVKGGGLGDAIEIIGEVGTAIVTSVYAIKNEKFRQQIVSQLNEIDKRNAEELEKSLTKINDVNERIDYMSTFLSNLVANKSSLNLKNRIEDRLLGGAKSDKKTIYYIVGGAIVLFGLIFIIKRIKK
jgi:hypothetical protein